MPRFQLMSDLHLEVDPSFVPTAAPDADALILAGDIGGQGAGDRKNPGSKLDPSDPFGFARFARWPVPVFYLPGNHEYDGGEWHSIHEKLKAASAAAGFIWLERESVEFQGVRVIGTTLWSDFEALSQWPDNSPNAYSRNRTMLEKSMSAANFYLRTTGTTYGGAEFDAASVAALAKECQAALKAMLAAPFAGATLVVTHFAPSLKSADPRYGVTPGTAGFCNGLDAMLDGVHTWVHGHLHAPSDYLHRGCRVVANPLGYARSGEQRTFDSRCVVEVGAETAA
jgi:Icc-related predicted phosphoesterase